MSYKSSLDLKLRQVVDVSDKFSEVQPILQDITNAVHLLNYGISGVTSVFVKPKEGFIPDVAYNTTVQQFWSPADATPEIPVNTIVHLTRSGWRSGAEGYIAGTNKITGRFYYVLEARSAAGNILLGEIPRIVNLDGTNDVGREVYTRGDGKLYIDKSGDEWWKVGHLIEVGVAILYPGAFMPYTPPPTI